MKILKICRKGLWKIHPLNLSRAHIAAKASFSIVDQDFWVDVSFWLAKSYWFISLVWHDCSYTAPVVLSLLSTLSFLEPLREGMLCCLSAISAASTEIWPLKYKVSLIFLQHCFRLSGHIVCIASNEDQWSCCCNLNKRPSGRSYHTWLRAIESDPIPLSISPLYTWKKASSWDKWLLLWVGCICAAVSYFINTWMEHRTSRPALVVVCSVLERPQSRRTDPLLLICSFQFRSAFRATTTPSQPLGMRLSFNFVNV